MKPILSIIIVHYQVEKELFACITSLEKSKTTFSFEIIVVDNDEHPTIEKNLKQKFPDVHYIKNPANTGYGAGNNLGASQAKGQYLFFLNPDTEVSPPALQELVQILKNNHHAGIVAPLLLNKQNKPYPLQGTQDLTPFKAIFSLSFINKLFPNNAIAKSYWMKGWDKTKIKEVSVVPGTAFMMSQELFKKLNGFDEKFFLYFEETDLCKRVSDIGYKLYIIPEATVMHLWGESTKKSEKNINDIFSNSRYYYFKKHFGIFYALLTNIILTINKQTLALLVILFIGIFLRFYNIQQNFFFDGEIGDNLLQVKNALVTHQIPLLGPPTSHPWLSFGPLYYWLFAPILVLSKFNPLSYVYFGAVISIITMIANYWFVKKLFTTTSAIISTFLMSISFMFLNIAHAARFFSVIPLLTYLFLFFIYTVAKGNKKYLFPAALLFGVMLNFHYTPLVLIPFVITIFFIKKIKLSLRQYISMLCGIIIPLIPLLIYDSIHRFTMTINLLLWLPYRFAKFLGVPIHHQTNQPIGSALPLDPIRFLGSTVDYIHSPIFATLFGVLLIIFVFYKLFAMRKTIQQHFPFLFIFLWGLWGIIGVIIHGSPPDHYYSPILAFPIILSGLLCSDLWNKKIIDKILVGVFLLNIILLNGLWLFSKKWFYNYQITPLPYAQRMQAAQIIIQSAHGQPFVLKRVGYYDNFTEQYAQNYVYLLWYFGNEPVQHAHIIYTVYEDPLPTFKALEANETLFPLSQHLAIIRKEL